MITPRVLFALCAVVFLPASASGQQNRAIAQSTQPLIIDGRLDDPVWAGAAERLVPTEPGVPSDLGGEVRIVLRGADLIFAARCPEPRGKVLARSTGRNPIWEKDSFGSPEVEDRVRFLLGYRTTGGLEREIALTVNPWGAYRMEQDKTLAPAAVIPAAALVTPEGWTLEASLPLNLLDLDRTAEASVIRVSAERIRSRRALAPEFRWAWPGKESQAQLELPSLRAMAAELAAPEFRPPAIGNSEPPLDIGKVLRVPDLTAEWDHRAWRGVSAFSLPRNELEPRPPSYPTEVKWMHDGETLALLVHLTEPEPVVARNGGRDSAVTSDDHFAVYLATSGSGFLEIAVNSVGAIRDSIGKGRDIFAFTVPQPSWNASIEARTSIRHGAWTARINIPLKECASALGESGIPKHWRVLIARLRADRPGEAAEVSALPIVPARTFYGPVRYRRMTLSDLDPASVSVPQVAYPERPKSGLAGELAALDPHAWPPLDRRYRAVKTMVQAQQRKRAEQAIVAERREWDRVQTLQDWEKFRDVRLKALREGIGAFPQERAPLDVRVTSRSEGDGYRLENLVFQSRPGFYVAANLFLPLKAATNMPGMIIVHSNHYPKIQGELQDMGMIWARAGCAVLIIERLGFGERVETTPWFRQAYASRFVFSKQLALIGQSYSSWGAWDVVRSVDFLYSRPDIDRKRIIVLGSVAGGAEPAALAAALDSRITAIVPFNYDQGHMRVHGDARGQIGRQFSPWLVAASVAPRYFIRPFEFSWEGAEEPDYPELWVSGWLRSQKVWGFYGAVDHIATSQGYGLIRLSMERVSHCWSIGPNQRKEIYPILNRWFQIPLPSPRDFNMLPDSDLSTNPDKDAARLDEGRRRLPEDVLRSITPAVSAAIRRKPLHEIARETGVEQLQAARRALSALSAAEARLKLRRDLAPLLGDIEPPRAAQAEPLWSRSLSAAQVEAVAVRVEDGITVPMFVIRPAGGRPVPVVVAVAQAGKERFLADRSKAIADLIQAGVAVSIPDLRGSGETAPDFENGDESAGRAIADMEFSLANTLLGARLKDLRAVLSYLRGRPDLERGRIALWGDSFSAPNPPNLYVDELQWQAGPQFQLQADPLGAHLALLAALYEDDVRAVAAQGGLAGYLSVLGDAYTYLPMDVIVPGVLKAGDIADIAATLAPRPLSIERFVSGRNVALSAAELDREFSPAREAYQRSQAGARLRIATESQGIAAWLIAELK